MSTNFHVEQLSQFRLLRLHSADGTNRLTRACVFDLLDILGQMAQDPQPLILTGGTDFFSVGADLNEVSALTGPAAYEFSKMGQSLMDTIARFPVSVYAAICGFCMGGGLDLALACHRRIATSNTVFGHRGAALGLITGWGGTQRLPRIIGKAKALQIFTAAEKINAAEALQIGLVDALADDPVLESVRRLQESPSFLSDFVSL